MIYAGAKYSAASYVHDPDRQAAALTIHSRHEVAAQSPAVELLSQEAAAEATFHENRRLRRFRRVAVEVDRFPSLTRPVETAIEIGKMPKKNAVR